MAYRIVDSATLTTGPGPHPAASPYDRRVSPALAISAFEVYTVELPPGAETVRHDHVEDGVEDLYFVVSGDGWVVVDDEELPLRAGLFVSVSIEASRQIRAGSDGLVLLAVCGAAQARGA